VVKINKLSNMNTKTLLVLLLCGVCFACNAPQQDGQKTDLTKENMTNGELREKLALALEDMKAKAIEMGVEGVATASVLNSGDTVDWIGEMKVVGSYCNWKDGYNMVPETRSSASFRRWASTLAAPSASIPAAVGRLWTARTCWV
jgi:hypothetical protein